MPPTSCLRGLGSRKAQGGFESYSRLPKLFACSFIASLMSSAEREKQRRFIPSVGRLGNQGAKEGGSAPSHLFPLRGRRKAAFQTPDAWVIGAHGGKPGLGYLVCSVQCAVEAEGEDSPPEARFCLLHSGAHLQTGRIHSPKASPEG